jgi:outer membrane protein TolC
MSVQKYSFKNVLITLALCFLFINKSSHASLINNKSDISKSLLTIEELKQKALDLSPTLLMLKSQKSTALYQNLNSKTHFFPIINFNLKKQKNFLETNSALLKSLGLNTPSYQWSLDYGWDLFNQNLILQSKISSNNEYLQNIEWQNGLENFNVEFKTTLLNLILAKYKQATILNSLKKAQTQKKEAEIGFNIGQKTKIDVLRAEAFLVSLNSKKTTFEDEEQNAKSKFIEKTGINESDLTFLNNLDENEIIELIDNQSSYGQIEEKDFNLPTSPLFEKISAQINQNQLEASKLTIQEWPSLKLQGSFENSGDEFSDTLHSPTRSHSIALVLTIPLFSGGSLITSNFEEYFQKKYIAYSKTQQLLELENKFKNTKIKINALKTLVDSLTLNVSQYEELYRLTSKSYQLGKSTFLELLDVQDNLLDSKINLANNKIQLFNLVENYKWQLGNK